MKRKILLGSIVMAIAAMAAWNVNIGSQMDDMSDLSLANVEALAQGEIGEVMSGKQDRYNDDRNCFYQCVDNGDSCYYVYNLGNAC